MGENQWNAYCPWRLPHEQYAYEYPLEFQENPFPSAYNGEWRNPNLFWEENHVPEFVQPPFLPFEQYTQPVWQYEQPVQQEEKVKPSLEEMFVQYMQQSQDLHQQTLSSIHYLETQMHELSSIVLQRNEEILFDETQEDSNEEVQPTTSLSENELFEVVPSSQEEFASETQLPQTESVVVQPQFEPVQSETLSLKEKFSVIFKRAYIDMPYSVFPWLFLQKFNEDKTLDIQEEMAQEVVAQVPQLVEKESVEQLTRVPCSGQAHKYFDPLHSLLKPHLDHIDVDENWVFKPP